MAKVLTNNEREMMVEKGQGMDVLPLGLLGAGERADVVEILRGRHMCTRVEDMGIREGKTIEVLNNEGRGPILIKANDSRIALGRGMAMKIMVRRLD